MTRKLKAVNSRFTLQQWLRLRMWSINAEVDFEKISAYVIPQNE